MSAFDEKYTAQTILSIHSWVPGKLFSFRCTRPAGFRFTSGQFARLGVNNTLQIANESEIIWRAYSMVSSPYDEVLEFFSIAVPNGSFTSHLSQLKVGDTIFIDKTNSGFLTTSRFESGTDLWLLASGTGLAPFLSIVYDPDTWEQFERVVLVHSAQSHDELAYQELIRGFTKDPVMAELIERADERFFYVPVVTREQVAGCLGQRITALIQNGALEQFTGLKFSVKNSRWMICGNPEMVTDIRKVLKEQGFSPARRNTPGEIAVENYW